LEINILKLKFDHFGILAPFYERFIPPNIPDKLIALVNLPVNGIVLDAGGGTGRVAQFLRDKAAQVIVTDQSYKMLQEASKKVGLRPICSLTERMPFRDNSLARIIMVDALHHVVDQIQTAEELWRILAPTGRIVVEEPDISSFRIKLVAIGEKLALMRSHFLSPPQIANLFHFPNARVQIKTAGTNAWIIVEKGPG
jgi:demethylmenaquinone methyltransferase/2-methoxy-6-polyprenyl-1,4-benzoquinol methylase